MYPLSELDPLEPCKIKEKEFRGFEKMFWIFFFALTFFFKKNLSKAEVKINAIL